MTEQATDIFFNNAGVFRDGKLYLLLSCDYILTPYNLDDTPIILDRIAGEPLSYETALALLSHLERYVARGVDSIEYERRVYAEQWQADNSTTPKTPKSPKSGHVYLIERDGYYKIGVSTSLATRIESYQNQAVSRVTLICSIASDDIESLERELHTKFSGKVVKGEWLNLNNSDIDYIKGLAS